MLHYVFSNCRINCFRKQRDLYRSVNITIVTTIRERHKRGLTQRFSMYPTNIFQALRDLKATSSTFINTYATSTLKLLIGCQKTPLYLASLSIVPAATIFFVATPKEALRPRGKLDME